jgi:predicted TIM-barrel fold metal-dependent hydrolase
MTRTEPKSQNAPWRFCRWVLVACVLLASIERDAAAEEKGAGADAKPDRVVIVNEVSVTTGPGTTGPVTTGPVTTGPGTDVKGPQPPAAPEVVNDGEGGRDLSMRRYTPKSRLVLPRTPINGAKYPVVDVHTHFFHKLKHNEQGLKDFLSVMDRNRIRVCVSLDGMLGDQLESHLAFLHREHRDRFVIFANVDWQGDGKADDPASWACLRPGFAARTAEQLRAAAKRGVAGLKVFKLLGLGYRDVDGTLLKIDDPRWDEIWAVCGELGIPVLIHSGDPAPFFDPIDRFNERWEELSRNPAWSFYGGDFPKLEDLMAARNRVIARHPKTNFIAAHLGSSEHDLKTLGQWLDTHPNLYVDIASRINELGRQPYSARAFMIRYADRIIFGTDGPWPEARLNAYWRFLETFDEAFHYSEKEPPPQGLWLIDGIGLPDEVLRKVYHENAARLIPGVKERLDALDQP